jgi:photosystem II stability/assembly factor-like uncharacterized protein
MKKPAAVAVAIALGAIPAPARAMTVDEVVSRYVDAHGGLAKMHALQSVRAVGTVKFGDGDFSLEAAIASVTKRGPHGNEVRVETTIQGITGVDAYDGADAWSTNPFEGRRDPFRMSSDEAKSLVHQADLDGPIVEWREKGNRIDLLGTEDVDGTQAIKLRVVRKDGDVDYYYLDPDTYLEIRVVEETHIRGTERVGESDFGSYAQVAGVWMPLQIASGPKGAPRTARLTITRIDPNVATDDAVFRFPAAGAAVGRAIETPAGPAPDLNATPPPSPEPKGLVIDSGIVSGLGVRNIGSAAMSGRVSAVAGFDDGGMTTLYVGAASGGVWRSIDGGTTFKPVFDREGTQSIGAITIDPSNPKTVWVGTGESWTRNSVSIGDGIYKSTDGGATWQNMGLPESERIARILVHPKNGDVVYACVPGKLWSDSAARGLYKTVDGGKHWSLVLNGPNPSTGCSGLTMDPKNPDVLFAGLWDFRRKGWTFRSGGEGPNDVSGSGLYRTTDGGSTWTLVSGNSNPGLPPGPWGRVEVEIAPSDPNVVYAVIEGRDAALYRSSDGGRTWEQRDKSSNMVWRPFYFSRLVVDPTNPDRLFKPDLQLIVSEDGGRSFAVTQGESHADWHDLWIDPQNPKHVVGGNDGGFWLSYDGGSRWWKANNLPISQFYHVAVDDQDPYQVYGGLQDNSSWVGDSSYPGGITNQRWENLYGGDGFWVQVDPSDPTWVYAESQGGFIGRVNRKTHASRDIQPKARYKEKLRYNWNTPIAVSPTQKGTVYIGAQFLFRSRDHGDTWERISPDLTTNDPSKQKQEESGGITVDNSVAEMHTTIYSISESPLDAKTIWVGTDDGNVQLTRDAGRTWTNLTPNVAGLPPASWVSWVEASRFDKGTAYATFDRHTFGDMTPWVYRTTDYGKTWTRIVGPGSGVRGYAHVVKEDAVKRQLLFVGTELGLWISVDGGATWAEFKPHDFPAVAVRDVAVQAREGDLVLATHGRGIWIVDDLTPLRALTPDVLTKTAAFLPGRDAQERMPANGGWSDGDAWYAGRNAPGGAVITYYQRSRHMFGALKLEILDAKGKVLDTLDPTARRGINRVAWTMQLKPPRVPRAASVAPASFQGPRVLPGTYTVRLTKGGKTYDSKLVIGLDRRAPYDAAGRKAQFDALVRARDLFGRMSDLVDRIEGARSAADQRAAVLPAGDPLRAKIESVSKELDETRKKIVATKEGGAVTGEERVREHLDQLYGALTSWEGRPARYQIERLDALTRELDDVAKELDAIVARDVRPLDGDLKGHKLDPIPTEKTADEDEDDELHLAGGGNAALVRCARTRGAQCEDAERAIRAARAGSGERD